MTDALKPIAGTIEAAILAVGSLDAVREAADGRERAKEVRSRRRSRPRPPGPYDRPLPTIRIIRGDIERVVDEAEIALIRAGRGLYQRANAIVCVIEVPAKAAHGRVVSELQISERGDHALLEDISCSARFEQFDKRAGDYVICDPPMWVVLTMRERRGRLKFPVLSGIMSAPTLRADGSVLRDPGYDEATGLFFSSRDVDFPNIPDRPSKAEAVSALGRLRELLDTFPFASDCDLSVALSGILTATVRPSLPSAPMHAFTAPVAGTGKTKIVDIISVIALGHAAPVISPGADEAEFEKRLGAALLAGRPMVAIDNISRPLEGDVLCQVLSSTTVQLRILGQSVAPTLSTGCFIAATGNNLSVKGDLNRRAIVCRLDAKMERPEDRVFDWDAVEVARLRRPEYLAASLTILRAWHVAERPEAPSALGGFTEWSDLVRGALIWLGCADPVESTVQLRYSDPEVEDLRAVMAGWRAAIGAGRTTVAEIIRAASDTHANGYGGRGELAHPEFFDSLVAVAGQGGVINSRRLGKWLHAQADRVVGDSAFVKVSDPDRRVAQWQLRPV